MEKKKIYYYFIKKDNPFTFQEGFYPTLIRYSKKSDKAGQLVRKDNYDEARKLLAQLRGYRVENIPNYAMIKSYKKVSYQSKHNDYYIEENVIWKPC